MSIHITRRTPGLSPSHVLGMSFRKREICPGVMSARRNRSDIGIHFVINPVGIVQVGVLRMVTP